MVSINEQEIEAAGLDQIEVQRIARGLSRYAKQAAALGLTIFGGACGGSLRFDDGGDGALIVAELDGSFEGGDGAFMNDADGICRGEN
ncbi:hypothetical protein QU487_06495 [Crenobacter sp. SG2305]|uniref:hypothetical protein n=1 Tax=Crenobacter oryzisoli TaxID=3056844 RepID=UPI0025AA8AEC|nr:hypothetical protein [Crenobacter sp. SG2305]MDN0082402.1 hypothetical protein [Crenobacter sp. SG2305]